MRDRMCQSCGSNIEGQKIHLCSIKTAKGWRQEIPLHKRNKPLFEGIGKLDLCKEDTELYQTWLDQHKNADAMICDIRTGYVIQVIYDCPPSMTLSETTDFFANTQRLNNE